MQLQLVILAIILSLGYSRHNPQENNRIAIDHSFLSTYRGIIPCADCEGISSYTLALQKDGNYQEFMLYMGKNDTAFVNKGKWSLQDDSVVVLEKKPQIDMSRFLRHRGNLVILDITGKVIEGNTAAQYILQKLQVLDPASKNPSTDVSAQKRLAGIDFMASGNDPFWSLEIDFDKQLFFHVLGGDSIYTSVPLPIKNKKNSKIMYEATAESGKLEVILQAVACTDNMSGNTSGYTVEVNLNGKNYAGCGRYLFNAERLHDIWALEKLNGENISAGQFSKGVPMVEIYVLEQKVIGHSGCNSISGRVIIEQNNIHFNQLISTKIACPGNMEAKFMANLNATDTYRLEAGKLLLLKGDAALLQFKKID